MAQWVHCMGSIRRPTALSGRSTTELRLAPNRSDAELSENNKDETNLQATGVIMYREAGQTS